jgi:predicted ATPase
MITRLEIDGFKSLREFAVDLEPLTVFIGPNSAGKSNILDALALLSRLASQPVEEAFKQGRGRALDQFTRRGGEAGSIIRFAVEVVILASSRTTDDEAPTLPNRYRYELTIERRALPSGAERLAIKDERLRALDRADREIFKHVADKGRARHALLSLSGQEEEECTLPLTHTVLASKEGSLIKVTTVLDLSPIALRALDALKREGKFRSRSAAAEHAILLKARDEGISPSDPEKELSLILDALSSYRLIHLDAARLREPSERIGIGTLAPDASNLPTVLANLSGPLLGEIRADLVSLVPGISSFDVVPDGDAFRIDFELSSGERLPARLVSDGTLRVLGLLTAARVEPRPAVIGIEEPENGVYPGRLRKLLELLLDTVAEGATPADGSSAQIILTTHSPVVLAAFRSRPQHLRFIDLVRRDGQLVTRARPVKSSAGDDRGRSSVSVREIDRLLHAADGEIEG